MTAEAQQPVTGAGAGSDAPPAPAPAPGPSRPETADPNYILSQAEFHGALNESEIRTAGRIDRRNAGLRETAGWIAVSLAIWLLLIGHGLIKGHLKGDWR